MLAQAHGRGTPAAMIRGKQPKQWCGVNGGKGGKGGVGVASGKGGKGGVGVAGGQGGKGGVGVAGGKGGKAVRMLMAGFWHAFCEERNVLDHSFFRSRGSFARKICTIRLTASASCGMIPYVDLTFTH